ncbi:polyprenyl synthetase family protein [Candidatus Bathyarchaeota archaeon]|nr:polyprenyl synthetase family protein [Candidatus Bathyarchaeota archaeon]
MVHQTGKKVVANLQKRSEKGLRFAKKAMREEKMENPKLAKALKHYLAYWHEFTHAGLFSIACEVVGGNPDDNVQPQASITMMAAAFDIHDDIIDKSKTKHKKLTVYGKFGVNIALLLGNAFLIAGFKLFVDKTRELQEEKEKLVLNRTKKLLFEVGNAHAIEVCGKENDENTLKNYLKITKMKAASTEIDMYLGALFGEGKENEVEILFKIGRILGIIGTLRDDLIDVFDIEELSARLAVNDPPIPLIFAMLDTKNSQAIKRIISKKKLTKKEAAKLWYITLESKPVLRIKQEMKSLIKNGLELTENLSKINQRIKLQVLLSNMLEDL